MTNETQRSDEPAGEGRVGRREAPGGAWYRYAVEESPNPFLLVDAGGRVLGWNRACEKVLAGPLAGRRYGDLLACADDTPLEEQVARAVRGEPVAGVELRCTGPDGQEHVLLASLYPAHEVGGAVEGCVIAASDVTDRVRFEQELQAAKEAAEAAAQLKSTILNNLSHEIRTPLTAILGFAELLFEEAPEPHREFIHLIRASGKRLMGTLVAVLELARLESGDVRFVADDLDLCEETHDAVRMFASMAESKGLSLELLAPQTPLPVHMDRVAVNRILSNLISNALKFTQEGHVRVEVMADKSAAILRVSDTGIGISEAFLPYLFDEFKQESEGLSRRHEGAGLGLAITRRLVEQMGGSIGVESAKGKGTTFTVRLPRVSP